VPPPRDYKVAGTKVQPPPRKLQLRTMAVSLPPGARSWSLPRSSRDSSSSSPPLSGSRLSSESPSAAGAEHVAGAETHSESAHGSPATPASPPADVEDTESRLATPAASPSPPAARSEAAFRRDLIREANRLEREQLQNDLAMVDRILHLRATNPPGLFLVYVTFMFLTPAHLIASLAPARDSEDTPPPVKCFKSNLIPC